MIEKEANILEKTKIAGPETETEKANTQAGPVEIPETHEIS